MHKSFILFLWWNVLNKWGDEGWRHDIQHNDTQQHHTQPIVQKLQHSVDQIFTVACAEYYWAENVLSRVS